MLSRLVCLLVGHEPTRQDSLGQGLCKRCRLPLDAAFYRRRKRGTRR
jgi:hypothetical protein